ncbi:MAG TPA: RidA family protein [Myxococcota bacterium]|nr:RidA family protein [Myxococcota bacterium]
MKEVIPAWMKPIYDNYHFAPAVIDGDCLRCSGMIGMRPDLSVPADPSEQFTLAFENPRGLLAEAAAVKDEFLPAPYAAWTAIGITEPAVPGALVEIQVTARIGR